MSKFVRALKVIIMMTAKTKKKRSIRLTDDEVYTFNRSKYCHICKNKIIIIIKMVCTK